ncbi:putative ferric-chelate reductase 1 [Babylonia areolata]|uniref:putative ferric-chelate reductase 1 n=1 Tax=Babylonia areolata TaxID=304850 RepID=UPI003FD5573F
MISLNAPLQVPVVLTLATTLAVHLHVQAYPTGAGKQACALQSPQVCHKGSPQTSASPYSLVVKDNVYSPGTPVNVTVQVTNGGTPFKGFLVGAHRVAGNTTEYLGSFANTSESQPQCGDNGNTGVTHTDPSEKQSVVLVWTPPSSGQDDIVFTGAVVQSFSTYWVNLTSGVLKPRGYPPANQNVTTTAPPPTTQPTTTHFPKDPGCGQTKACYGDCHGDVNCTFLATWYKANQSLVISFKSAVASGNNLWVALGFGTQAKMNPASVTECVTNNGEIQAFSAYNENYENKKVSPDAKIGLSNATGSVVDGVFTCTVHRQIVVKGGGPQVYNLTTPFHILMARGEANGWDPLPHDQSNAFVTENHYDVTSHVDIGARAQSTVLVKLHGCLMTLAWILSASIGVLVARFFKHVWPTETACGVKVWFAIHRLCMVIAFVATVTGFVCIFLHVGTWSEINGPLYKKAHPILGTAVTALTVINPIMSIFRCDHAHKHRPLFNWSHFLVGTSAYILGVVTVGIGINMPSDKIPEFATYCVIGFGAWHALIHLMLEVTKCLEKNDSMVAVYKDIQSFSRSFDAAGYHAMRQAVFTLHVLIALGVFIAITCAIIGL